MKIFAYLLIAVILVSCNSDISDPSDSDCADCYQIENAILDILRGTIYHKWYYNYPPQYIQYLEQIGFVEIADSIKENWEFELIFNIQSPPLPSMIIATNPSTDDILSYNIYDGIFEGYGQDGNNHDYSDCAQEIVQVDSTIALIRIVSLGYEEIYGNRPSDISYYEDLGLLDINESISENWHFEIIDNTIVARSDDSMQYGKGKVVHYLEYSDTYSGFCHDEDWVDQMNCEFVMEAKDRILDVLAAAIIYQNVYSTWPSGTDILEAEGYLEHDYDLEIFSRWQFSLTQVEITAHSLEEMVGGAGERIVYIIDDETFEGYCAQYQP